MSPVAAAFLATAAFGALCGLVGAAAGRRWARREWAPLADAYCRQVAYTACLERERATLLEQIAYLSGSLADADQAVATYREAVPKAFDLGLEAGQHAAAHQLARVGVQRAQRDRARWN